MVLFEKRRFGSQVVLASKVRTVCGKQRICNSNITNIIDRGFSVHGQLARCDVIGVCLAVSVPGKEEEEDQITHIQLQSSLDE